MKRISTALIGGLMGLGLSVSTSYATTAAPDIQKCLSRVFQQLGNPLSRDVTLEGPSQIATTAPHDTKNNLGYLNFDTDGRATIAYSCLANKLPYSCNYLTSATVTGCRVENAFTTLELTGKQAVATLNLKIVHGDIASTQVNLHSQIAGLTPSEEENAKFTRLI